MQESEVSKPRKSKDLRDRKLSRNLAGQLFLCRCRKGGTLDDVSKFLGISKSTLTLVESGLGNPSMALIAKLAAYYQVKIDDLIRDPSEQKRVIYRQGEVIEARATDFVSIRQILSHRQSIRVREFQISQGRRLRLKAGNREWKELLICNQGHLSLEGFAQSVLANPGQFLELIPHVEKKIWAITGDVIATLIQIRNEQSNFMN